MTKDQRITKNCERCGKEFKCSPSHGVYRKNCCVRCSHQKGVRTNTGRTLFKKGGTSWNKGLHYENPLGSFRLKEAWRSGKFDKKVEHTDYELNAKKISAKQQGIELSEWNGFVKVKRYTTEFYKVKDYIKFRCDYSCQLCGNKKNLCIHHIDYNKQNNQIDNLICLCSSCHPKTNYNRNDWKNQIKLIAEAGGKRK